MAMKQPGTHKNHGKQQAHINPQQNNISFNSMPTPFVAASNALNSNSQSQFGFQQPHFVPAPSMALISREPKSPLNGTPLITFPEESNKKKKKELQKASKPTQKKTEPIKMPEVDASNFFNDNELYELVNGLLQLESDYTPSVAALLGGGYLERLMKQLDVTDTNKAPLKEPYETKSQSLDDIFGQFKSLEEQWDATEGKETIIAASRSQTSSTTRSQASSNSNNARKITINDIVPHGAQMIEERKKGLGELLHVEIKGEATDEDAYVGAHRISPVWQGVFGGVPDVEHLTDAEYWKFRKQQFLSNRNKFDPFCLESQLTKPIGGQQHNEYEETLEQLEERLQELEYGPSSSTRNKTAEIRQLKRQIRQRESLESSLGATDRRQRNVAEELYEEEEDQETSEMEEHITSAAVRTTTKAPLKHASKSLLSSGKKQIASSSDRRISYDKRLHLLELINEGQKITPAARSLRMSTTGGRHIRDKAYFDKIIRNRPGRSRVLMDHPLNSFIIEQMKLNRKITKKELHGLLTQNGFTLSLRQLRYRLKVLGFSWRKMKRVQVISKENQLKRLNVRSFWESEGYPFSRYLFVDETTVVMGRTQQWCWVQKGEKVPCQGRVRHGNGFHLSAGISWNGATKLLIWPSKHRMNSAWYCSNNITEIFAKAESLFRGGEFELVQDNHPAHVSHYTLEFLKELGIPTFDWPPQSPDWNPIEFCWRDLKEFIARRCPSSMDELLEFIEEFWSTVVTPSYCRKLILLAKRNIQRSYDGLNHEKDFARETVYQK